MFSWVFQVHYDLGGIFFQQGCTDQTAYQKARDHFQQTKELLTKVHVLVTDPYSDVGLPSVLQ